MANDAFMGLRASLSFLARNHDAEEIVHTLSEVLDDRAAFVAERSGDYSRAAELKIIARYLARLGAFVDNYDPTPE